MKKFVLLSCLMSIGAPYASHANVMFGDTTRNSIELHVAQGTGPGTLFKLVQPGLWDIRPMTLLMAQYSQPMEIMRLPARMNVNFVQNFGYHGSRGLSFFAAGVSWDVALLQWYGWYLGGGIGPYMRDSRDRYVSSRLVFGEKVFIGKNITNNWRGEIFTLHFSNGDFTEVNRGFNYVGLGINYSF
ncbi:MAG: acyloxyacyl hydrolase [Alphaproteobacteria bacterium]|nr:acyloxyacyl hydrolase [Alphaproteobacteria bacterium]